MKNPAIVHPDKCELTAVAAKLAARYMEQTEEAARKNRGQFFTPESVARYMASMFQNIPNDIRLLDSGAGLGILIAAVCDRVAKVEQPCKIEAVLFETDSDAASHLSSVVNRCEQSLENRGHRLTAEVREEDFVSNWETNDQSLFAGSANEPFDLAIMNPPYFKIRANSYHASVARRLGSSQPNIYSLFMALAIEQLRPGGELVAITPRSFCSGLYFRDFRKWLFRRADLLQVHTFGSRTDTFREAKVLQENVITHFRKRSATEARPKSVTMTRSWGRRFESIDSELLRSDQVIDDTCGDSVICVPEQPADVEILNVAETWRTRFSDTGLKISTGPVVMFRTRCFHREQANSTSVPLLTSHHVANGRIVWPREKKKWPSAFENSEASGKHLVPCQNYVLLKRFTSKEEKRRLSAGVLAAADFEVNHLALENHINYITHMDRDLTMEEATGVAAVFNSALMDRYFRSFSGNTQVNATEVRTMKFPDLPELTAIGSSLLNDLKAEPLQVVMDVLDVPKSLKTYLEGFAT